MALVLAADQLCGRGIVLGPSAPQCFGRVMANPDSLRFSCSLTEAPLLATAIDQHVGDVNQGERGLAQCNGHGDREKADQQSAQVSQAWAWLVCSVCSCEGYPLSRKFCLTTTATASTNLFGLPISPALGNIRQPAPDDMSKQQQRSDAERRDSTQRFFAVIDLMGKLGGGLIKYGALVAMTYFSYKAVASLGGKETLAKIAVSLVTDLKMNQWLCYVLAGGSAVWALGERRLRRKKTTELTDRLREHEKKIDPNRSSSSLPPSGTTRTEDEL
jgi:hypothetical protein